jgi:putative ABC transport system substrate-binding protein
MQRRDFVTLFAGTAAAPAMGWPLVARAQQRERVRRIGVFSALAADDAEGHARIGTLMQGLDALGWSLGRNLRIDYRWAAGDSRRYPQLAAELLALAPDVIVANNGNLVRTLQEASSTVPIVFVGTIDPVAAGRISSLARPGGNATGFLAFEYGIAGKWLELLKQIAPHVTRVAVLRDPSNVGGAGMYGAIQGAAPSFGVELQSIDTRSTEVIERGVADFARGPNSGLIGLGVSSAEVHRDLIVRLAARYSLPAVYGSRLFVLAGGLISYAPEPMSQWRDAAGYVDRILRGEKPSDLPVQAPVKYETVLNLKTAKALGLDVPPQVLVRADEVIE